MRWLILFVTGLLAAQVCSAETATSVCESTTDLAETQILGSKIAFHAILTEVAHDAAIQSVNDLLAGFDQKITFRVLHSWKGSIQPDALVHATVHVTTVCGGYACVLPFKVDNTVLVISPATPPSPAPMFIVGCWVHEGIAGNSILILPSI